MIIAIDTCVLVDFHYGEISHITEILEEKLKLDEVFLPPIVITEYLSNPRLDKKHYQFFKDMPTLVIADGYWQRAAEIRRKLLEKGLKAKLGDALIAQACIDNKVPLLTRDDDFRHYAKYCDLKLVQNN